MNERRRGYARGGAALAALSFSRALLNGFGTYDESWFLQVLTRVARGDILYRDVFFGATPLSVEVMAPAIRALGSEIVLVRAAAASITAATSLVSCRAAERLGVEDTGTLALLGLAVAVYASPSEPRPLYSQLAALGQSVCLAASVTPERAGDARRRDAVGAGLAAGVAFAAKHNVGLATLGALACSPRKSQRPLRSQAAFAGMAFAGVTTASLAPVVARGAGRAFLEYAVTNKRRYLRMAGLPYLDGLRNLSPSRRGVPLRERYGATKFLVPPITALLLLGRTVRGRSEQERETASLLGLHGAAAFLGAFPRADEEHVSYSLAPQLVGLAWATAGLSRLPRTHRVLRTLAWLWLAVGTLASFCKPLRLLRTGRARLCRLPHYRGIVEDGAIIDQVRERSEAVRGLAEESPGETFLVSPNAAQYWLLSGIPNPTPYDYPYATAFGHTGERDTADAIRRGEITAVMIDVGDPSLAAWEVIRAAEEALPRVEGFPGVARARRATGN